MSYVYAYIDPLTSLPFYIGKGTKNRVRTHLYLARCHMEGRPRDEPSYFINKLISILRKNKRPGIEIIKDHLTHDEAFDLEKALIKRYGRKGIDPNGILTNRDPGGKGSRRNYKMPKNRVEALIARNKKSKGKPKPGMSLYIKENPEKHYSYRQKGVPHSEKRKLSNSNAQREKEVSVKIMTFQSPSGEVFVVKEWREFLVNNGLSYNLVRSNGKEISKGPNAGWRLLKRERFYSPSD